MFDVFVDATLARGRAYWWRPRGFSMTPAVRDGDRVLIGPASADRLRIGDIVKVRGGGGFTLHRLVRRWRGADGGWRLELQGDNVAVPDAPVDAAALVGVALAVERDGRWRRLDTRRARLCGWLKAMKLRARRFSPGHRP